MLRNQASHERGSTQELQEGRTRVATLRGSVPHFGHGDRGGAPHARARILAEHSLDVRVEAGNSSIKTAFGDFVQTFQWVDPFRLCSQHKYRPYPLEALSIAGM